LNILYHHRTAADDGQAVHIRELQSAFRRAGHDLVEVALVKRTGASAKGSGDSWLGRVAGASPRFLREFMEQGYDVAGARALRAAIAQKRPDFIYERYALSTACGARVAKLLGIPFVLEVNSPLVDEVARTRGLAFPGWARRKELYVLNHATLVAVVSGALREWALSCGVEPARIVWTPNGVDLSRWSNVARRRELVEKYQLEGKTVVGFTGFVRDWHRLDLALRAMKSRRLDERGAVLVIVGDGPALPAIEKLADQLQMRQAVRFCGKVAHDEIQHYVALFDVALVTAINAYASPLKLFEYLAAEVATIVVDQPNLREVLDGQSAWYFKGGDVAGLAEALERAVTDSAARRRVGKAGRALLLDRDYTWDGNVRRVLKALQRIAAPQGAGGSR
jgi:glycosyltransferase involved in cell wall biosynthesis